MITVNVAGQDIRLMESSIKKSDIRKAFRDKYNVPDSKTVLQFSGSTTHYDSLILIKEAIEQLLEDDRIIVSLVSNLEWLMSIGFKKHENLIISGWVKFEDAYKLPAMADITLVPLPDSKFNRSKSELKIIESAAWKIPCIASAVAPYQRFHDLSDGGCILIKEETTKNWVDAVYSLMENKNLYNELAEKSYNCVRDNYSLDVVNKQRLQFWNKLKQKALVTSL